MKFELEPYNWGITKAEVVADISSVARHLGKNTLTADEYREHGKYSPDVARRRCGSWLQALTDAGLSRQRKNAKISPGQFIPDLKRVAKFLGKSSVTVDEYRNMAVLLHPQSQTISEHGLPPLKLLDSNEHEPFMSLMKIISKTWNRYGCISGDNLVIAKSENHSRVTLFAHMNIASGRGAKHLKRSLGS